MSASTASKLASLPLMEVVGSKRRLSARELLNFERTLAASDAITVSYFKLRRKYNKTHKTDKHAPKLPKLPKQTNPSSSHLPNERPHVRLGFGGDSDDSDDEEDKEEEEKSCRDAAAVARALTKTIAATTHAPAPDAFANPGAAMRWAAASILAARDKAIDDARRERGLHTLTTEQSTEAYALMTRLNTLLSQPPTTPPA